MSGCVRKLKKIRYILLRHTPLYLHTKLIVPYLSALITILNFCAFPQVIHVYKKASLTFSDEAKKKVKCTLVQALRLCTSRTVHKGVEV